MSGDVCDLLCLDVPHAEAIREALPAADEVDAVASVARVLGDRTRLSIAAALAAGGELCVCDLAWVVGLAQNLVSHHLRQLKLTGLASSRRQGRLVLYTLSEHGRVVVEAVLATRGGQATGGRRV